MKSIYQAARILSLLAACIVPVTTLAPVAYGQRAPLSTADNEPVPALIRKMVGAWEVRQRMWPISGDEATELPSTVAQRRLIGGVFLQEVMKPAPESKEEPFTRIAYFNYNAVSQQYEYFSMDSRAPQMMNERSYDAGVQGKMHDPGEMILYGEDTFVIPQWGEATNVAFRYRLVMGEVENNRQIVRLHLTPQSGESLKEFLAFEYVYTRQH